MYLQGHKLDVRFRMTVDTLFALNYLHCGILCFRLQPNLDTRKKQLEGWSALILDYHKVNKKYTLDVVEAQTSELFYNKKIDRKLSPETIEAVLEELRKKGSPRFCGRLRSVALFDFILLNLNSRTIIMITLD